MTFSLNYFCHKYNMSKTLLKSTVWNKTQARLHHDQWWSRNNDTLENWHLKVFRTIEEFFKLVDCQILSQTSKGGKQGNCLVSSRKGIGWQGKLADQEVWREEKISKLWINQSNNSDEKLFHQNHDWDQSTKICWDPYLLLNVNINSCQQIN